MKADLFVQALKNMKGKWTLVLLGVLGLLLLLLGGTPSGSERSEAVDSEDYRRTLAAEVTALCREVRGVGEVSVLLTLEAGESALWAENENGYVTAGGEGLLIESRPPRVAGVAVVCTGGGDAAVREELCELLSAALGIGRLRVRISAKK